MPSAFVDKIHAKYYSDDDSKNYTKPQCKNNKSGCTFCADPDTNFTIIDCDKLPPHKRPPGKMNDCIIFEDGDILRVGLVETKGKSYKSKAQDQLSMGAVLAKTILDSVSCDKYDPCAIIVLKKLSTISTILHTKNDTLSFGNQTLKIRLAKCGMRFSDVLSARS